MLIKCWINVFGILERLAMKSGKTAEVTVVDSSRMSSKIETKITLRRVIPHCFSPLPSLQPEIFQLPKHYHVWHLWTGNCLRHYSSGSKGVRQ